MVSNLYGRGLLWQNIARLGDVFYNELYDKDIQIMAMDACEIESMIRDAFPDAQVEIQDLAGDGDHYAASDFFSVCWKESCSATSNGLCRS